MKICSVDGCERKHEARGYCKNHYRSFRKYGDPFKGIKIKNICNVIDCNEYRFSSGFCSKHYRRFRTYGNPIGGRNHFNGDSSKWILNNLSYADNDCLLWPYHDNGSGYGRVSIGGKQEYVHVVMCTIVNGQKPTPNHEVAHSCGQGHLGCVNPRHVRWATPSENQHDRLIHGTHTSGEKNWNTKLTENDIGKILELLKTGYTHKWISDRYNVSRENITRIKNGKVWSHITGITRTANV